MTSRAAVRRFAVIAGGSALTAMGVLAAVHGGAGADSGVSAGYPTAPLAPTTSTAVSVAPAHPVDCADPNNAVNCQTPPLDSPMAPEGTAAPGSPFRD